VTSKAIVAKCQAEGIESVKDYRSVVSAGLAASIREWFSEGEHTTAVETAEKVDLSKVRRRPRRRKKRAAEVAEQPEGRPPTEAEAVQTAVAEAQVEAERKAETAETAEAAAGEVTPAEQVVSEQPTEAQAEAAPAEEPAGAVAEAAERPEEPAVQEPGEVAEPAVSEAATEAAADAERAAEQPPVTQAPAPTEQAPPAPVAEPETVTVTEGAGEEVEAGVSEEAPAAEAGKVAEPVAQETAPDAAVSKPEAEQAAEKPQEPAEPEPVKPAGPRLIAPLPAQIQGPRVVRVTRPDTVRPARPGRRGPGRDAGVPLPPISAPTPSRKARGKGKALEDETEERPAKKLKGKPRPRRTRGGLDVAEHIREWRDKDLLERQERIQAATVRGLHARRAVEAKPARRPTVVPRREKVQVEEPITVKDLCSAIGQPFNSVFQKLVAHGVMARINDTIDAEVAQLVALEFGIELEVAAKKSPLEQLQEEYEKLERKNLQPRPPVVAFLGHVDHGKTSLLDRIRRTHVAESEAGGITQHIGAYTVEREGWSVTFLDTPGHEAFTALRARGANLTDIVVLVVAADDGVMPQTVEAINHAKAAKVPIVVALNKIDLPGVDVNRVYSQLSEQGLVPSEWGGDIDVIKTSAVTGEGIDELVEHLHTLGELLELKADPTIPASGAVVESHMREGAGPVATVLVQEGTLRVGDILVCGTACGRVRLMIDDKGRRVQEARPSMPVEIAGLDEVPQPGEKFYVVDSLQRAKEIAEERREQLRQEALARTQKPTSIEDLLQREAESEVPELNVIIKADVQGSVEVLRKTLSDLPSDQVRLNILHAAVGGITESDVLLAEASKGVIVGFNVVAEPAAQKLAEQRGVPIRLYRVIYDLTDDLKRSLEGMLEPEERLEVRGRAEVREVFRISRIGVVAGCYVTDGIIARNLKVRVIRDNVVIRDEAQIQSLRRFKDDVREVRQGMECGLKIADFDDIKVGDVIEAYEVVKVPRKL